MDETTKYFREFKYFSKDQTFIISDYIQMNLGITRNHNSMIMNNYFHVWKERSDRNVYI